MRCPFCDVNKDKVIDSRETDGGKVIRRRRECKACAKRWTTRETVEESVRLTVIKRDGSRVPYDRTKVLAGLQKACYKRPVAADVLAAAVDEVEDALFKTGLKEIDSTEIGRQVVERLKRIDHVAFLRFASVYLKVTNIDDLLEEMHEVKESSPPPPEPGQGALF